MIPIMKPTLPPYQKLEARFKEIFENGWITNGKYVEEFEQVCAAYLGSKYAIAVSSGTTALASVVRCLNLTGEVILPSFTWCASAHSLLWNRVEPVFVDIDPNTFCIDHYKIEAAITENTSAIMAVHMFGNPCDNEFLERLADKYNLKLIYDGAHAFGSQHKGDHMGGWGTCTSYSLSPSKIITTGEGGLVTTNNLELAKNIRLFRNQGVVDYDSIFLGINARMTEMQGILGIEMIPMVDELVRKKYVLLEQYIPELKKIPGITLQSIRPDSLSSYKDFNIMVDHKLFGGNRDYLADFLENKGISTKKYYSPPVHRQGTYKHLFERYNSQLAVTNWVSDNTLTLPLYPDMPHKFVEQIVNNIRDAYKGELSILKQASRNSAEALS